MAVGLSTLMNITPARVDAPLRSPGRFDDVNSGFSIGSHWYVPSLNALYVAASTLAGAALWQHLDSDVTLPLDAVTGALSAWGVCRLRAAYTGNLFQVIRASDNATLDVGQVGYEADWAAVDAFGAGTTLAITILYDQSGNGRNWTPASAAKRPTLAFNTIGGRRVVTFAGVVDGTLAYQSVELPTTVTLDRRTHSAFSIIRHASSVRTAGIYGLDTTNPVATGSEVFNVKTGSPTESVIGAYNGSSNFSSGLSPDVTPTVLGVLSGTSNIRMRQNDDLGTAIGAATSSVASGAVFGQIYRTTYPGKFDAMCFILFDRTITDAEELRMRRALYRLGRINPQREINIVVDGDSISQGALSTALVNRDVQTRKLLDVSVRGRNYAYFGQTAAQLLAAFAGRAALGYSSKFRRNIYSFLIGHNTLNAGISGADLYATVQAIVAAAKAIGYDTIFVGTVLPSGALVGTKETERLAYNALLRAGAAALGVTIIDYAANPIMGAANAPANTALYGDQIHPLSYGYALMAADEAAAFNITLLRDWQKAA